MAADEARVSHVLSHVVWWKKKYIYIKNSNSVYEIIFPLDILNNIGYNILFDNAYKM